MGIAAMKLKDRALGLGANLVGIADVSSLEVPFDRAISVAVALNRDIVSSVGQGPHIEYQAEYLSVNAKIDQVLGEITGWIHGEGYSAVVEPASSPNFDREKLAAAFPHKTAATMSGLGWVGKNALLVTKEYGSAVRLGTIFTDAPLQADVPQISSLCGNCTLCRKACPVAAPGETLWSPGIAREDLVDIRSCWGQLRLFMEERGLKHAICGICIQACPWTKKYLHGGGSHCFL